MEDSKSRISKIKSKNEQNFKKTDQDREHASTNKMIGSSSKHDPKMNQLRPQISKPNTTSAFGKQNTQITSKKTLML
ncbi:hypothetical protein AYI70_g7706 [Smittium culicis]|uniref:Uncharacterized protein n=1 Tax=Smittium culicis TaxID=133412 RepID=A0A1R1XJC9_9FUNG|nr:hypothetical protein AYI70_g7706 [Smittium culicis]